MPMKFAPVHAQVENLKIEIYSDGAALGEAAAQAAAEEMRSLGKQYEQFAVIFATGASQLATLDALTAKQDLPWSRMTGFHMDEYIGIAPTHPASFRRYLRENLISKVPLKKFHEIDGTVGDVAALCRSYGEALRQAAPRLCLFGIGENGHLAFNDPAEADFNDPVDVKVVHLDEACRIQQAGEGWFESPEAVPSSAISVTIPALLRTPRLILSVPGPRKAAIIQRILTEPISTQYPATILRRHPNATLYLDRDSAAEVLSMFA